MLTDAINWVESKKFIETYSRQDDIHYKAYKLDFHIRNYVENRPNDSTLDFSFRSTVGTRSSRYGEVRGTAQFNNTASIAVQRLLAYEQLFQAKQYVLNYNELNGDNEKELQYNYIYYIANRGKFDKLNIGRIKGACTPNREKKLIEALYGHKCVMCGSEKHLQIHHIDNLGETQNRDIENQICVCNKCHCEIHGFEYKGE